MMNMKPPEDGTGLDSVAAGSLSDASHFRQIVKVKKGLEAAQKDLRDAVAAARAAGDSWTVIGAALGTSKQAAFQRFAKDAKLVEQHLNDAAEDVFDSADEPNHPEGLPAASEGPDNEIIYQGEPGSTESDPAKPGSPRLDFGGQRQFQTGLTPAFQALARKQQTAVKFAQSPAFKVLAEKQLITAKFVQIPALTALAQQQGSATNFVKSPTFKPFANQQLRITRIAQSPAFKALAGQHGLAAKFATSSAFKALAEQQVRITRLAESPELKALAAQQLESAHLAYSPSIVAAWQSQIAVAKVVSTPSFRCKFLGESRVVTDAFANLGTDPAWSEAIVLLRADPKASRLATGLADILDRVEVDESDPDAAAELMEVMGALPLGELAQASAPLEAIARVAASAVEGGLGDIAESVAFDEEAGTEAADSNDVENYQMLLNMWGIGNVVAVCVIGAVVTGQFVSFLVILAAIAQISGYSLKDLLSALGSDGEDA
jgi:hypothetical protein